MRTSLSLKMLLLTLGSFILLIIGIIASLFVYFDRLYAPQKINRIITAMNEFIEEYDTNDWTDEQLYSEVLKFMKNQNVTMSIMQSVTSFVTTPATASASATATASGESSEAFTLTAATLPSASIHLVSDANNLQVSYINALDFDLLLQSNIKSTSNLQYLFGNNAFIFSNDALPLLSAKKTQAIHPISNFSGTATNIDGTIVMYPATYTTASSGNIAKTKDGITYTLSSIPYTNYRQVNFNKEFTLKNGETKNTYVNLSLQSVDEVMSFLISFFPYLIIAVILLSFFMVTVYSKTITKPIISITNISNRMANMELGIKSGIKRKDELGALSASLNTLSSNLKNSLEELSTANEQLKIDYENELRQENARKEFVANVSHELKTPLGIIKSYSEGLQDGIKSEKRDYYIQVILDEITRMDQMLLEMLEISKFDAGVITYQKTVTDIRQLLDKSIYVFMNKIPDKNISFELCGEYGSVLIDSEKIQRVLNNLIENAVKYCNFDSVIKVTGKRTPGKQLITIENSCQPLTQEVLDRLWERFYKADTSHSREIEGTGLGLSITKSILEGHGCSYGVSNTDNGVCFYFDMDTPQV